MMSAACKSTQSPSKPLKKAELLMPAGSLLKLKIALLYGADAVYLGTPDMGLRSKSQFSFEEVAQGIEFAHQRGKRVYLTLNLFSHNKDIPKLEEYIKTIKRLKPDGLIVADPGIFQYVKAHAPGIELHISTQANLCSWLAVQFWETQGADLAVLAREVSFDELAEIREKCPDIKLEAFVHGSMCMTYSGRCLLSNFLSERGANQGSCTNSCRWNYTVQMRLKDGTTQEIELNEDNMKLFDFFLEEKCRPGELLPIEEDERGSYILNSKDLCLMPKLDKILNLGIDSLKVEGRNKSPFYVGVVARAYRMAIDAWETNPEHFDPKPFLDELKTIPNRGYTHAFFDGRLTHLAHNYEDSHSIAEYEYAGILVDITDSYLILEVKNRLLSGDVIEFVLPQHKEPLLLRLYEFEHYPDGKVTQSVHAGQRPLIKINFERFDRIDHNLLKEIIAPNTLVRKEKVLTHDQKLRLTLDKEATNLESNKGSISRYHEKRIHLQKAVDESLQEKAHRSPKIGEQGCCKKGCNGCLVFWNEPKYAKARALLKQKGQGFLLTKKESQEQLL